ncbi:DUF3325 domain-containing protein [Sphingomonas sp. ac-8]|uniref:DUF3325 domain-containing protein n=1 Tax=Sphingomonas sp. ac-8 TaxID=3242977 RepID=UPI003A80BD04
MHLATLLFAFAGFTALCLAMDKHQLELLGARLGRSDTRLLRSAAVVALTAAYACSVAVAGWRFGSVEWVGAIMIAALAMTLILPYRPRWIVRLAVGGCVVGVLICATAAFVE